MCEMTQRNVTKSRIKRIIFRLNHLARLPVYRLQEQKRRARG